MEDVLYSVLGQTYVYTLPLSGEVSKSVIHTFLLARSAEGASRAMVISELHLWKTTLLEIGDAIWPSEWCHHMINRIFPIRMEKPARAKEALTIGTIQRICTCLLSKAQSTDYIERALALRDLLIITLGFTHLLRRSEIVQVRLLDFDLSRKTLHIPRSKTD